MSNKENRKLKKMMRQWYRKYGLTFVRKWLREFDRRMLLDGEVCMNKKGEFVDCPPMGKPILKKGWVCKR